MIEHLVNDASCFACGKNNPDGLHLEFVSSEAEAKTRAVFIPQKKHQGWKDIVHGGIILTLLDEAMAKAAAGLGHAVLTGQIKAKFRAPARVLESLLCEAEVVAVKRSIVYARAKVYTQRHNIIAEAESKMMIVGRVGGSFNGMEAT